MKQAVLQGVFCALILVCAAQNASTQDGYIFTSSRSLKTGASNELHFRRFGKLDDGFLNVQVFYKKSYNDDNETVAAATKFEIPEGVNDITLNLTVDKVDRYAYSNRIEINGTFGDKEIYGSSSVRFSTAKSSIVIIQTDKPLYQPGQTVQFRVLKVNKHLKPSAKNSQADVFIEDPKGTRLSQFLNVDLTKGIIQRDFELSDEPVLGRWTIKVVINDTTETTGFDVKEYVLPKYDVNIKFPSFVLVNEKTIHVEICAKYTYGKDVIGTLNLTASLETHYYDFYGDDSSEQREKFPTLQETVKLHGCYNYILNVSQIDTGSGYSYRRIKVVADVIEDGTGVERSDTEYLNRETTPLKLAFVDSLDFYKPGLPYNGKLKVSNPDNTVAAEEHIEICATIDKKRILAKWWATKTLQVCQNYTSDENGIIRYTIMPQNIDAISISLNAKSTKYGSDSINSEDGQLNQPQTSKYLNPYYSPSGSFIQIQPVKQPVPCGSKQTLKLLFTSKQSAVFKFYYTVTRQSTVVYDNTIEKSFSVNEDVSGQYEEDDKLLNGKETQLEPPLDPTSNSKDDDCPEAKESRYTPPIGEVDIDVEVGTSLSPEIHVLVYYVRDDDEVVADSMTIEVTKCLPNKVDFAFGDAIQQPGLDTVVKIKAGSNSLCGIKAVDKSISLLDDSDQLTTDHVFKLISGLDTNQYYTNNPCYQDKIQPGLDDAAFARIIRPPPSGSSSYQDSLSAFQTAGFLVISDLFIVTRPCRNNNYGGGPGGFPAAIEGPQGKPIRIVPAGPGSTPGFGNVISSTQSVSAVRDFFPETWLFELENVGPDGTFETSKKLPDTITEWIGSAVCINSEDGLGISNTTSIKAFQAFFLDYTLPISVIRGEEFVVVVSVFNYVKDALPITVSIDDPEGYEITGQSIDGDICVQSDVSTSLRMTLKATKVGKINITVRAETAKNSKICGNSSVSDSYARDAIKKSLEVEAEGFPAENVINSLVCPSEEKNNAFLTSVSLSVPNDVVPDSSRAYIDFTGNVMGPAISNLNSLVNLPTGCGEQNMVKFTPNYLVLDYLQSIGQLTDEIKTKAIRNLNIGYQRELTYQHYDGSFSAFGETDKTGSMFLTAFVLRSFYEAQRYIAIDDHVLKRAQNWIVSKQGTNGCFPNIGRIFDIDLQGGLKEEFVSGSITAYVLASLLISHYDNATIINDAFNCLENSPPSSPYSEFLYAYSYALDGNTSVAQDYITEARQRVSRTGGMESFIIVNGTEAIEIETDAYAVLTTLAVGGNASDVLPYIRYLTSNLNPNGGFKSTQDTCVGLHALSQFASIVYKDPLNLEVEATGSLNQTVDITKDNQLLVQRYKVSDVPSKVNIKATGTGCGLIQSAIRYNTKNPPEKKMFSLQVIGDCSDSDCIQATVEVLVSYLPSGLKSGMSIVEVKLITGFVAVRESLDKLKSDKSNNILRVDVQNNKVIFYLSEISNSVQKFSFEVNQVVEVKNAQPGTAKVYDYYANENSASTSYLIEGVHSGSNAV